MESGTIVKWTKTEGEEIAPGDVLCEIQTDKAVVSMEMDDDGTLAKILVQENTPDIAIGAPIAVLAEPGEDWQEVRSKAREAKSGVEPSSSKTPTDPPKAQSPAGSEERESVHGHDAGQRVLGPAVKALLETYGLKKSDIAATGPHGVLLKGDVLRHISQQSLSARPSADVALPPKQEVSTPKPDQVAPGAKQPGPVVSWAPGVGEAYVDIPLTNMRKTIAKRLSQSKASIPHSYATAEIGMEAVGNLRRELKASGVNVSVNDFIIKAAAFALRSVPEVNVQLLAGKNGSDDFAISLQSTVDISVAVATESGLITPIIFSADSKGLEQIAGEVRELAGKAKEGKLQPNEFMGGTFTVSNLGMFGISEFTAIINPPQGAILAIGGSFDCLRNCGETIASEPRMRVTLCFDNRAISESSAGNFLSAFTKGLEDPFTLLLGQQRPPTAGDQGEETWMKALL